VAQELATNSMSASPGSQTIKHEQLYLHAYDTASVAKKSLTRNVRHYNGRSPRTALDRQTPDTTGKTSRRRSTSEEEPGPPLVPTAPYI
jgi:hypothetical protein